MKSVLELDVDQLVGRPELGVDGIVELNNALVLLGFGDIGSFNEEGNPVVATIGIEVGGQEVVAIDVVLSALIDVDDNVDLVASIDVLFGNALVDKSDESSLHVEGRVGRNDFVETEPGELTEDIFVGFLEGVILVEFLDVLPVFEGFTLVEDTFVYLQKGSLVDASVVVGLVGALQQEGFEVEENFEGIGFGVLGNNSLDFDYPVLVELSEFLLQQFRDGRESRVFDELL